MASIKKVLSIILVLIVSFQLSAQKYKFLIGTFTTNTPAKGIYTLKFNEKDLSCDLQLLTEIIDPSFLSVSKNKKSVFAISERGSKSNVVSYSFNNNQLKQISKVEAGNYIDPCHITATKKHIIIANYSGGSIYVFNKNDNGSIGNLNQKIQHQGKSLHPTRQTKPHAHQVVFSPDGNFLLVNDLGIDKVLVYKYNKNDLQNTFSLFDTLDVKSGSGPRHLCFDKSGTKIYLLQELDGTISTIAYQNGKLSIIDTTTLVRKSNIETGAADIHLSPDGKFLYATNRGTANDITCFATSPSGKLKFIQQVSTEGEGPRNFCITDNGKFVLVGNQRTNDICIFNRNFKTGELTFTGKRIPLGAPVCILEY